MKKDAKNIALVVLVIACAIWTVWHSYNRFYVEKDFLVSQHVTCDPETENCFVWQCDPAFEECSENEEENRDYYKIIEKSAAYIEECSNPEECEELTCEPNEPECMITACSPNEPDVIAGEVMCSQELVMKEGSQEEKKNTVSQDAEALEP